MTQAMTVGLGDQANVTLSGRELAMQRRQAMARLGKAAVVKPAMASSRGMPTPIAAQNSAAMTADQVSASMRPAALDTSHGDVTQPPTPILKPARARREALSRMGKAALPASQQRSAMPPRVAARWAGLASPAAVSAAKIEVAAIDTPVAIEPAMAQASNTQPAMTLSQPSADASKPAAEIVRPPAAPTGRALAQARRAVLAKEGKNGLRRVAQAVKIAATLPEQNWQAAIAQGATGRQIAMQHRLVRSLTGRSASEASAPTRPTGRVRPTVAKGEAPVKVEVGHTLSGQTVTGTLVERSKLVTGLEPGATRVITGTEYVGAEEFERAGIARPQPAPPKVQVAETPKGKTVTGALMGRSPKVTGNEVGATRALTGTAYLDGAPAIVGPDKVAVTHTAQGKTVTGTFIGRGSKMTGDERGLCARVTGTEYLSAEQLIDECAIEPTPGPAKVTVSTTLGSQPVTGAAVGRSAKVTGDEPGACRPITGSQYYNTSDFADLCPTPSPRRPTSVMSPPVRAVARSEAVAHLEPASPKSVGDAAHEAACATAHPFGLDRRPAISQDAVAVIPAALVTGDRPGAGGGGKLTGDERGACQPISGTPYLGEDNAPENCPLPASGRFNARPVSAPPAEPEPVPMDFSIISPARAAWERRMRTVTGSADWSDQRITGPINKASGLITGTPDFRHRVHNAALAEEGEAPPAATRISGCGAGGPRITGDAWQAQSRVTGTEGTSAIVRNPSLRGEPRGVVVGARELRGVERQPIPESKVTGSAGNTKRGALVTVSGGARA